MNQVIKMCMNYSGMREDLTEAEYLTVADLINTEFKTLKDEDVVSAFKMNASGKYWKAVVAYQTFSPMFVGEVLGNYKEWLRKANLRPKNIIEHSHRIENKQDLKEEQKKAFEFIERIYKETKVFPIIANWSDAFLYAQEKGLIDLSNEDKEIIKKEVINEIKLNQLNQRIQTGIKGNTSEFESKNLKVLCRKRTLQNYFKR